MVISTLVITAMRDSVPKKFLIIIHSLSGGGGTTQYLLLLLKHLDMRKFNTKVIVFNNVIDYSLPAKVEVIILNKKGVCDYPLLVLRIARIIRQEKPHIVLSIDNMSNILAGLAHKLAGVKAFLLYSENNPPLFSAASANHKVFTSLKRWLAGYVYTRSDIITTVSQGIKESLVIDFGVPEDIIKVIYNGVDLLQIRESANENINHLWLSQKTVPVIISIGRLHKQKGYPYLLRAFAMVKKVLPCRLMIIGEGEERERLERLAAELGIDDSVSFLGFQQNPCKFLSHSDIFVLSSLWEGFGRVLVEAMACGVPVVSTRCPSGPGEIINDRVNGLLVPPADEKALADAILNLLQDENLRKRLSINGRKRAEDFGIEVWTREFQDLLKREFEL